MVGTLELLPSRVDPVKYAHSASLSGDQGSTQPCLKISQFLVSSTTLLQKCQNMVSKGGHVLNLRHSYGRYAC